MPKVNTGWRKRYEDAHRSFQEREYPATFKDHGWLATTFPDVRTSNGLTRMVLNFLKWSGHRATRVNTQGQFVVEKYKGRVVSHGFRKSTTRRGTADVSSTIAGRAAMFETKVGRDRISPEQLREQRLEREAGGVYEFIATPEEFFAIYDQIINREI